MAALTSISAVIAEPFAAIFGDTLHNTCGVVDTAIFAKVRR